jgi:hypothetical protein
LAARVRGAAFRLLLKNSFLAAHLDFAAPLSRQYKKMWRTPVGLTKNPLKTTAIEFGGSFEAPNRVFQQNPPI